MPRVRFLVALVALTALVGCNAIEFNRFRLRNRFSWAGLHDRVALLPSGRMHFYEGGDGPPLLLLHGFGFGALENWEKQAPAFAKHHHVIAPDLYWFGQSVPARPIDTPEDEAEAVRELLDALHVDRADIVGASFGGLVALRIALTHPDRVDRLILVDAAGMAPTQAERDDISATFGHTHSVASLLMPTDLSALKNFLGIVVYRRKPPLPDWVLRQVMRELSRNREAKTRLCRALEGDLIEPAEFARIRARTLVIWGGRDPLLPLSIGERMAKAIPGSQIIVFDDAAHSSMLELPTRFDTVVSHFLDGPR